MKTILFKILGVSWLGMIICFALHLLMTAPDTIEALAAICLITALGAGILLIIFTKEI